LSYRGTGGSRAHYSGAARARNPVLRDFAARRGAALGTAALAR